MPHRKTVRVIDEKTHGLSFINLSRAPPGYGECSSMTSSVLFTPVGINRMTLKNRIVMPAMASYHAAVNGEATEKLIRYHEERAKGGVGMNIVEATYVARSGNSFDLGLGISDDFMIKGLSKLTDAVHRHDGKIAIQLQHGGRFGNPPTSGCPRLLVSMIPGLAPTENARVMDADDIEGMVEAYVQAARRAVEAGFDAVEIHGAHGYLINQFMSPLTNLREDAYGGSFENRTRALFDIIDGIRRRVGGGIEICVRLNAYDCVPYPYGWGMVKKEGVMEPDLTEPVKLCNMLVERGVKLINLSTMMPRYRPYGTGLMAEHDDQPITPYAGVHDLLKATRDIKAQTPGGIFMCTGLTWLEQFGANVGAGGIEQGWFDIAGFGRQAFAYPDFAKDILCGKGMQRNKCCLTCDKCYDLIQIGHTTTGCVPRDQEVYLPLYRKYVQKK